MVNLIYSCILLFEKRDRILLLGFLLLQLLLHLLDVIGVILITGVVSIAVAAVRGGNFPKWVDLVIEFLNLKNVEVTTIATIFGVMAGTLFIAKSIFSLYLNFRSQQFISSREVNLTHRASSLLLKQDLTRLSRFSPQQYQHTLSSGVNSVMGGVVGQTMLLISELVLQISMLFLLSAFSLTLTSFTLLFFLIVFFSLNRLQGNYSRMLGEEITKSDVESFVSISSYVRGYREILISGKQDSFIDSFLLSRAKSIHLNVKRTLLVQISKYVFEIAFVFAGLALSAFSFYTYSAEFAASLLALFLAALTRISTSVLRLQYGYILLKGYIGSTKLFFEMLDSTKTEQRVILSEGKQVQSLSLQVPPAIQLKDINFKYSSVSAFEIKSLDLTIESNQSVALVGRSGGGKSTIVDLILGVITPTHGQRYIYGVEPKSLYHLDEGGIAYVPQEVFVQPATVIENIALGTHITEIHLPRVKEVLESVDLLDVFLGLPNGLETMIGTGESGLSGGQRQRLGIARALYRNPKVLVLDEATSSLDAQLENEIAEVLRKLRGKITMVIVAHRLSTVLSCDSIIYVNHGKIIDRGTFEELRSRNKDFDKQAELLGISR
jgi:ATP-binding cassette subfamily C protein